MLRLTAKLPDNQLGPDEVRVAFTALPGTPSRYTVWRGDAVVGRVIDWADYPVPKRAPKNEFGYVMAALASPVQPLYGAEVPDGNGWREIDDAWDDRVRAIEAIIGEPIERGTT